jgi:hypothetical protein
MGHQMKHIAPTAVIPAVMPIKYIHCALTGRVIDSRRLDEEANWNWISQAVASWCDCPADEVRCVETDDGEDLTVDGEVVATLSLG